MSVIQDSRKLFQDLVAPDLKAILAQISGLAERMTHLGKSMEQRFSSAEEVAEIRHDLLLANFGAVIKALNTDATLIRLETQLNRPTPQDLSSRT
jgi:hypothetical protein